MRRQRCGRRTTPSRRARCPKTRWSTRSRAWSTPSTRLVGVLGNAEVRGSIGATDRANLAKYLTIAKLRLENAIALVRSDDPGY